MVLFLKRIWQNCFRVFHLPSSHRLTKSGDVYDIQNQVWNINENSDSMKEIKDKVLNLVGKLSNLTSADIIHINNAE